MFKKLRNKFIITNLIITTTVILVSFGSIYFFASNSQKSRTKIPLEAPSYSVDISNIISDRIDTERNNTLVSLAKTLIFIGISTEVIVAVISYFLSEKYIEPVKNSYESQKDFIANASHEIKTPVASIKANLEAADIKDNHFIDNVKIEADKISELVAELLYLAKSDQDKEGKNEEIDLKEILISEANSFESRLDKKTLIIKSNSKKIKTKKHDLEKLLTILIDNAIKYSSSKIKISSKEKTITITNDGTTIPKSKLPHIFDRFYQIDKTSEGEGLGLSIAKSLCEKNHWDISVTSKAHETTFKVVL